MAFVSHGAAYARGRRVAQRAGFAAVALALIGLALAGAGVVRLAGLPWSQAATSISARSWPVAEARILSASLDEIRVPGRDGMTSELALSVTYEFEAGGRTITGGRASLADRAGLEDRRLLTLYRNAEFGRITGRTMPVAYDPADPPRAFLDASFPWKDALPGFGLGAALLFLGGQLLARAARR
jgi:hypothetical protein